MKKTNSLFAAVMKKAWMISITMPLFLLFSIHACKSNSDNDDDDAPEVITYTVTYDGNGSTGGDAPVDTTDYEDGQTVTVLGNTGSLEKEGFFFNGWNTRADGSGTTYAQGQTFTMGTSDITLYAAWGSDYLYVSTSGDDANPGTLTEPKLTIQSAIDAATEPTEVRVAEGAYEITDQITMKDGVSLLGGYSEDFSQRDAAAHETIITDTREPTIYGVFSTIYCSEISGTVRIDGFTINGCNAVDLARSVCIYNTDSSPTISNNTITDGGTGTNSRGIENQSSSPIISNNTISVGDTEATARFTGIYNQSSSPIISNNTMSGGDTGSIQRFTGIDNQSSSPTILNNTINGGPNKTTMCITNHSSPATIMNNVLNAEGMVFGGNQSVGIYIFSSDPKIMNNIIHGGITYRSFGIFNDCSSPDIANNTINGGSGDGYAIGIQVMATYSSSPSQPLIRNNVIFTEGSGIRWGICEKDVESDPAMVRNNALFDCPDALYRDEDSVSITAVDQDITTGDGTQTLEFWGNINEGSTGIFDDFSGGDWHLSDTSPLNIRGGGITISGITSDKDDIARTSSTPTGMTNAGAAGWSMGAYEKD